MSPRFLLLLPFLQACQPDSESREGLTTPNAVNQKGAISHAVDIQPIWNESCTNGCHPGNDSMLSLEPRFAWKTMVGIPSVEIHSWTEWSPVSPTKVTWSTKSRTPIWMWAAWDLPCPTFRTYWRKMKFNSSVTGLNKAQPPKPNLWRGRLVPRIVPPTSQRALDANPTRVTIA